VLLPIMGRHERAAKITFDDLNPPQDMVFRPFSLLTG
jgi:hypothetical protein